MTVTPDDLHSSVRVLCPAASSQRRRAARPGSIHLRLPWPRPVPLSVRGLRVPLAPQLDLAQLLGFKRAFRWLLGHFSGCWTPVMVPEAAAKNGDLTMLQFLLQHDTGRDFKCRSVEVLLEAATSFETRPTLPKDWKGPGNVVYWGGRCIAFAMRGNNFVAAKWIYAHSPHTYSDEDIC
ncbi:hypothetical protein PC128_g2801 [Phytophthora cactorum]|uniref:Ankyrin repeat-containing domain n=1 Tax=Phytophthora cactorum TaxID=29920 RepID=A0A8T1EJ20_9STRA|nr:hypothetical protein PC117_g3453 [Phytophthora cactorum]KAG3203045.1 hypothetical protein PC128_g2801 [Phytophthora cactorum]